MFYNQQHLYFQSFEKLANYFLYKHIESSFFITIYPYFFLCVISITTLAKPKSTIKWSHVDSTFTLHEFNSARRTAFVGSEQSVLDRRQAINCRVGISVISNASLSLRYALRALVITRLLVPFVFSFNDSARETGMFALIMVFNSPMPPLVLAFNK